MNLLKAEIIKRSGQIDTEDYKDLTSARRLLAYRNDSNVIVKEIPKENNIQLRGESLIDFSERIAPIIENLSMEFIKKCGSR